LFIIKANLYPRTYQHKKYSAFSIRAKYVRFNKIKYLNYFNLSTLLNIMLRGIQQFRNSYVAIMKLYFYLKLYK